MLNGWDVDIDENTVFGAPGSVTVYTAEWDENAKQPFTVTFDIDATKGSTADTTTETVADGGFVTKVPTVMAKAGYRFVGWMDQDNKLFYEAGVLLYPITKATTFTAQFEEVTANPGTATVIFDANGGKIGNNSVLTKVGVPGTVVGIPTEPTRNGYRFLGWSGGFDASTVYGAESTTQTYTAQWEAIEYTIHFSATGASGATADQTYKFDGTTKNTLNQNGFTLTGKDFLGWSLTDGATTADFADGALINDTLRAALATSNGSITLYAVWKDNGSTGGGSSGGGSTGGGGGSSGGGGGGGSSKPTPKPEIKPDPGTKPNDPTQTGIANWLRTDKHTTSMTGYGNGLFGPENSVTRAQIAQIFYRLLKNKDVAVTVSFTDVAPDAWYAEAVNTLGSLGIVAGYQDGRFDPDRPITRAEFCAIATRFARVLSTVENPFTDISTQDWYYTAVTTAASYDWVSGMGDGTFRPRDVITRAQAATIINRMLGAAADRAYVDEHVTNPYRDVAPTHWAYYQIMEASIAHDHRYDVEGVEIWTGLK